MPFQELPKELPLFSIENAEFIYKTNFAGLERPPYDKAGDRYFNVKIPDDDVARQMEVLGWNVKWSEPGKNASPEAIAEHVSEPWLKVALGFKYRAPTIVLIRDGRPSYISENTVALLDSTEFESIDMVIRARHHDMQGGGYKAWLSEFYGTVHLSDMGKKWAHLLETQPELEDPTEDE